MGVPHRCVPNTASTHIRLLVSHRPSAGGTSHPTLTIQGTSRSSDRKTAIRKSQANGLRCFAVCDSVPQGRLSRSEWRTVDPVAQRPGLFGSTNPRQTCITPRPDDVASHEAVKFNEYANPVAASQLQCQEPNVGNSGSAFCYLICLEDYFRSSKFRSRQRLYPLVNGRLLAEPCDSTECGKGALTLSHASESERFIYIVEFNVQI